MNISEAIEKNDINFIKENIGNFNPNSNGLYDFSLLHRAVYHGYLKLIQLLIDIGADVNIRDKDNFTPLHSIIDGNQNNWFECIELLLKNKADVNTKHCWQESGCQETPLITAVRNEVYIEVIKLLLEHGADVNIVDSDGDKAINYAYDHNLKDVIKLLEEYGANYDGKITNEEQIERDFAIGMVESYKLRNVRKDNE